LGLRGRRRWCDCLHPVRHRVPEANHRRRKSRRQRTVARQADGIACPAVLTAYLPLSRHPATAPKRRCARLLWSLRSARPRSNDVRLIVHGTPLVQKSSACEVSQSTVVRGKLEPLYQLPRDPLEHPEILRQLRRPSIATRIGCCCEQCCCRRSIRFPRSCRADRGNRLSRTAAAASKVFYFFDNSAYNFSASGFSSKLV